jgi:hypothetical protein
MNEKMFVPFSEELLAAAGSPLGDLVPFQLEYRCVRLLDGTFDFSANFDDLEIPSPVLHTTVPIGHAA